MFVVYYSPIEPGDVNDPVSWVPVNQNSYEISGNECGKSFYLTDNTCMPWLWTNSWYKVARGFHPITPARNKIKA